MKFIFHSIVFLFLLVSCTRKTKINEPTLARVGLSYLTHKEAKNSIPDYIFEADSIVAYDTFRKEWINKQIVIQEAYRLNLHRQKEVQDRLNKIQEDYLSNITQDYIIGELELELSVTDEEARLYYQENRESFVLEERYIRFRHLVATSLSDAQRARQDLLRGISWEAVAEGFSISPEETINRSERFWAESNAVSDINVLNRYLKVIGLSEISVIEKVGTQYHFVQLIEERAKGDHPDLDWLIDQIKDWLILEKRRIAFNTYVKNLYLQAQANNEIETFNVLKEN